ncbi:MAG: hypothetical protein OXB84_07030 [Halobacteriovoraceae bacterium]|nr:hypothetical protein [Halobacteriovoraceae bacterium]
MNSSFLPVILLLVFSEYTWAQKNTSRQIKTRQLQLEIKGMERKLDVEIHANTPNHSQIKYVELALNKYIPGILKYFSYVPRDTVHIVIDSDEETGGRAIVWPRNSIVISPHPPLERKYTNDTNWMDLLIVHEFIHIVHIEQTHGILQFIRYLMGSLAKWGGMVPTWFAEGLAVWGESFFLPEGRLKNPSLKYELKKAFMDDNFCQTIDCLDEPGSYPYKRYPYWIGGFFLDFIEKQKTGSLSCIVRENSYSIPFFLNSAFTHCIGMDIKKAFARFRAHYRKKIDINKNTSSSPLKKIPLLQNTDWQKGMTQTKDGFFYLAEENRTHYLTLKNRQSQRRIDEFSRRLAAIPKASPYSQQKGVLPLMFYQSPIKRIRKWALWNQEKQELTPLNLAVTPQYLFMLSEKEFLIFYFQKNQWHIALYKDQKIKTLKILPEFTFLKDPQIITNNGRTASIFKIHESGGGFKLIRMNLQGKTQTVYNSTSPFDFLAACQGDSVIRKERSLYLITSNKEEKINASWTQGVFFWNHFKDKQILLSSHHPKSILSFKGDCKTLLAKRGYSTAKNISFGAKKTRKKKIENFSVESYPSFHHFLPHYWGFLYGGGETLDYWSFFTSMNDPMERYNFDIKYNFYPAISQNAPSVKFKYARKSFNLQLRYDKEYYKNSLANNSYNLSEKKGASISFIAKSGRWRYTPTFFYDLLHVNDFISQRKIHHYGLSQGLSRYAATSDGFFNQFNLIGKTFQQKIGNKSFLGLQTLLNIQLKWHPSVTTELTSTYGKLYKDGFEGGIIYGGGGGFYNSQSFHQFYGISYTDALGNEIVTGRFQLDIIPFDIYGGWGTFPLFLKDIHLLLGADYIDADNLIFNRRIHLNENLFSLHGGLRFRTTVAYLIPFNMDFLYTRVMEESFREKEGFIVVIQSGIAL